MDRAREVSNTHILRRTRACVISSVLLGWSAVQAGCTIVTIHDAEGATRVERDMGIVHISLSPSVSATIADVKSFGFVSGPFGAQAGFLWNKVAAASDSCRVIVWIETDGQLDRSLWQQIEQAKNVCVVDNRETRHASN